MSPRTVGYHKIQFLAKKFLILKHKALVSCLTTTTITKRYHIL